MNKIWIIGGANIDICGHGKSELRTYDSNIGEIDISFGGVARNIAEVCCRLNQDVNFISVFSNDMFGKLLYEDCQKVGMNLSYSLINDEYSSSLYIAILNEENDMYLGMNDMRILNNITMDMLAEALKDIEEDDYLIIDGNLESDLLKQIVDNTKARIVCDPVSVAKADRIKPILDRIDIYKPNQYEAKVYTNIDIVDKDSAIKSLKYYIDKGIKEMIISMSDKGLLLGTKEKAVWYRFAPVEIANATGGGDSFLAAYISERINGNNPFEAAKKAIAIAIYVIENKDGMHSIDINVINDKINSLGIEEYILWK